MSFTVALSDIHGDIDKLDEIFYTLEKKYPSIKRIIYVGDIIDRGLYTKDVLDFILDQKNSNEVIVLLGNHELLMLDFLFKNDTRAGYTWLKHGGFETVRSLMEEEIHYSKDMIEKMYQDANLWQNFQEVISPYREALWPRPHEQLFYIKSFGEKTFIFSHSGGSTEIWRKVLKGEDLSYEEKRGMLELSARIEDIKMPPNTYLVFGHIDKRVKQLPHAINICSNDPEKHVALVIDEKGRYKLETILI